MKYRELRRYPTVFQSFTGLNLAAFSELLPSFEQAYADDLDKREQEREQRRQRERGAGRNGALISMENKLLFILFYFKNYPVQEVQGYFFGMAQTQAGEWIHRLTPILNRALGYEKQLPARKAQDIEQVLANCPGLEFIIDGTERPIRRPKNKDRQKEYYSGKKKRHVVKNNVVTEKRTKKVRALSATCEGKSMTKSWPMSKLFAFQKEVKFGKTQAFKVMSQRMSSPINPRKNQKAKN